jgi:flagellar hook-basal body complex protein FliE
MTSPISGISSALSAISGITAAGGTAAATATTPTTSTSGTDFASILASSVDQLQGLHSTADGLATQAATGDLNDVADYMVASNEAKLATDTVVTLKNQAVSAFTEIMRMSV